jgi:dihydrofolate reductase
LKIISAIPPSKRRWPFDIFGEAGLHPVKPFLVLKICVVIINLIVAAAKNHVIGKDGKMPWHLPNDMKHFKNLTWGMPVIMGRKTFESLGKPLPGRKNIVITRQPAWQAEGVVAVKNFEDALFVAHGTDAREVFVIGGGEIYRLALERAKRIYLTRVDAEPEGDSFFPELNGAWKLVHEIKHTRDDKHPFDYAFQVWERK